MGMEDEVDDMIQAAIQCHEQEHEHVDGADYATQSDLNDIEREIDDVERSLSNVSKALSIIAERLGLTIPHVWKYGCCDGPVLFHIEPKNEQVKVM